MITNLIYLFIGLIIGFLVKHEIDIKNRHKRVQKKIKSVANMNLEPYNETLDLIKELNKSLVNMPSYQQTQKKEM